MATLELDTSVITACVTSLGFVGIAAKQIIIPWIQNWLNSRKTLDQQSADVMSKQQQVVASSSQAQTSQADVIAKQAEIIRSYEDDRQRLADNVIKAQEGQASLQKQMQTVQTELEQIKGKMDSIMLYTQALLRLLAANKITLPPHLAPPASLHLDGANHDPN
jgi:chromosome segregation ATPase